MPVELKIAAFGALLLFVHIFTATRFKTAQYGRNWNVGARDEALPPPNAMAGRTMRAQANFICRSMPRACRWSGRSSGRSASPVSRW